MRTTDHGSSELEIDDISTATRSKLDDFSSLVSQEAKPRPESPPNSALGGLRIGTLVAIDEQGVPRVAINGHEDSEAIAARCMVPCNETHVGSDVVLGFDCDDLRRPILMGFLQETARSPAESQAPANDAKNQALDITVDDERLELTADREIVLRCGKASITLTRAGKVVIRGAFLLSRSSGVNRIKGGSVQIN